MALLVTPPFARIALVTCDNSARAQWVEGLRLRAGILRLIVYNQAAIGLMSINDTINEKVHSL